MVKAIAYSLALAAALLASGSASAKVPYFAARCPGDISVETDRAGRAYIGGKKARVRSLGADAGTISIPGMSVDVTRDGGTLTVTYTGRNRAHGVCEVVEQETVESPPPAPKPSTDLGDDVPAADKKACLRAVRKKTRNGQVTVLSAVSSEANNTVTVGVGPQRAPWRCLVKRGKVADIMSQADEGAL